MRDILKRIGRGMARFHQDQRGAEGLEKLLIIAAIVLPLLGVLIYFRDEIHDWVLGKWEEQKQEADDFEPGNP